MTGKPLSGRVAVVTGAARGAGQAIAGGLAAAGAKVVFADVDGEGARAAAAQSGYDDRVMGLELDVRQPASVAALVARTRAAFGDARILVNNAGIRRIRHFLELDEAEWDDHLAVNLSGPYRMMLALAPGMRDAGGGAIVNITSFAARRGAPGRAAYCASKAGLEHLSRVAALDLGPSGIRVNCVAPAAMNTPMLDPSAVARTVAATPLGRITEPTDLVGAVVFLCGDDAAFITGATLPVDGGRAIV